MQEIGRHPRVSKQPNPQRSIGDAKNSANEEVPGPVPADDVELSAQGAVPPSTVRTPTALIPLSILLKVPFNSIPGTFQAIPVLLDKADAENPDWQPKVGTPLLGAPVIDAKLTLDSPADKVPVATAVENVKRDQLPSEKIHYPLVISESDRAVEEKTWRQAIQSAIKNQRARPGDSFINLTIGVDQSGLEALGNQSVVFAPHDRIDPETMTWKDGTSPIVRPEFLMANFLDEDGDPSTVPKVEYLMVDRQSVETDLGGAMHAAISERPIHQARVKTEWAGQEVGFDVEVTARFQSALRAKPGTSFEPTTGKLTFSNTDGSSHVQELALSPHLEKSVGQKLPPWLVSTPTEQIALPLNKVLVDIDIKTGQPIVSCPEGYIFRGATKPEAGNNYEALVPGRNGPRPINVRFSDQAAATLSMSGFTFSKDEALLYAPDGNKVPLDSRTHEDVSQESQLFRAITRVRPKLTGSAPAWTFEHMKTREQAVYAFPKHGIEIDVDDNGMTRLNRLGPDGQPLTIAPDDGAGLESLHRPKRLNREKRIREILGDSREFSNKDVGQFVPLQETKVNDHVTVKAPNSESTEQAKRLSELFLGVGRERDTVDPSKFREFKARVSIDPDGLSAEELMSAAAEVISREEVRKEICELTGQPWSGQSGEQLSTDLKRALKRNSPVEITVIPKGADVNAYLSEKEKAARGAGELEMAAFVMQPVIELLDAHKEIPTTRIFVAEELFETAERRAVVAHEMLHAYNDVYATDEELDSIESSYEKAYNGEREVPCLYGALRKEFLTTTAEEFLSLHGDDGPSWVKNEHPEIYGLLHGLTGFDPVTEGKVVL